MRVFLDIAYSGGAYFGFQRQPTDITVQETLEKALNTLFGIQIEVYGAGRTDARVHSKQMPVMFDIDPALLNTRFQRALNGILPQDIAVNRVYRALKPDLHARFDAISRSYEYYIMEHKSPFYKDLAWYHYRPLNFELMNEAAAIIKEYHSFESFCKTGANNKTYLCDIRESYWAKEGDFWVYHITADRFLRGMVRAIVGTLALIGRGRCDLNELRRIIEAKDRGLAGSAAPPQGLFLTSVIYPEGTLEEMEMEQ